MYTFCPCFSCGKQIKHNKFLNDAIEIDVFGQYGSKYDLSHMIIWICDNCIEEKMEERVFMINEDVNTEFNMEEEHE